MTLFPSAAPEGRHPISHPEIPTEVPVDAVRAVFGPPVPDPTATERLAATAKLAVTVIDPTARLLPWAEEGAAWIKGDGWETKICGSALAAWVAAVGALRQKAGLHLAN